ncbi:hypothetical protein C5L39_07845 [Corynebacterium alimapuense]|uniref:ATP-binding protein n=2 Tax=Corynebacterium alimapuense TaxID=1576874 RepID=A0A3M8K7C5_9CORY|nr:hypothetical protein C5L39_07845 [Corynebacterium alimapuense]
MFSTAVSSEFLPAGFHRPAPIHSSRSSELEAPTSQIYSPIATLAMLRIVAFATSVTWLLLMAIGANGSEYYRSGLVSPTQSLQSMVSLLFTVAILGVFAAGFIHRERVYQLAMGFASLSFVVVVAGHLLLLAIFGQSPLTEIYLGDFVGIPMVMLIMVFPTTWGLLLAIVVIGACAVVNLGTPLGFNTVLEISHSLAFMLPFLVLLQSGIKASHAIDESASRARNSASQVARLKTLHEVETSFLGHVHDRVLTYLDGVSRGVISPADSAARVKILTPEIPRNSRRLLLAGVLHDLVAQLRMVAPNIDITAPESLPETATISADVAAALSEAALEAASNTTSHAPGAQVDCQLSVESSEGVCQGVSVVIRDDGPGFDLARIPGSRAGVRVAITGRMQVVDGCSVDIETAPGQGTSVALVWHETTGEDEPPDFGHIAVPSAYEMVGIDRIFRPSSAIAVLIFFLAMSLNNSHPRPFFYVVSLLAVSVGVWALLRGQELTLPARPTVVTMGSVVVFFLAASVDNPPAVSYWPELWYPWVLILMCTYLAIRDRVWEAWALWGGCLILAEMMARSGFGPSEVGAAYLATKSIVLLPAMLISRLFKVTTRGLPLGLSIDQSQAMALQVAATQRRFLTDSREWIDSRVAAVLDPSFDGEVCRSNAHVLELRLRDSIRSPLFDVTPVNRAVWEARARGVNVRLLDDRYSGLSLPNRVGADPRLAALHLRLQEILDSCSHGSITARIVPAGRANYATIVIAGEDDSRREVFD